MVRRVLPVVVLLMGVQSTSAVERSLVVARHTTHGAIVPAPQASDRSVVVASREVVVGGPADTRAIIEKKERELERLRAEIARLKGGQSDHSQIFIDIEMIEISRTKLRRKGAGLALPSGPTSAAAWRSTIDALLEDGVAKRLCESKLVVTSGRPGSFHVGGEIPIKINPDAEAALRFQSFGTDVDVLATAVDREQVRMELRVKQSEVDVAHAVEVNGVMVPALKSRHCDTAVETKFGRPVVLHGLGSTRTETIETSDGGIEELDNEIMLLVVITPRLAEPHELPKTKPGKAARK